jgi:hypothetical protein
MSLETPEGMRFLVRSRIFTDAEAHGWTLPANRRAEADFGCFGTVSGAGFG